MGGIDELAAVCARRGFVLTLDLLGPTGHPVRNEEASGWAYLRVRVLDRRRGDVIAGRCQSSPGEESPDILAEGTLETLRRRGLG